MTSIEEQVQLVKSRCFNNQIMPNGIILIIEEHLDEYETFKLYKDKNLHIKKIKKQMKDLLYSYYAQINMSEKKWEDTLTHLQFKNKVTYRHNLYINTRENDNLVGCKTFKVNKNIKRRANDYTFKISDNEYKKITKLSKNAYTHFCSCVDNDEYIYYEIDDNINTLLESNFYINRIKYNEFLFIRCFKTSLALSLHKIYDWTKISAIGRSNLIVNTLIKSTEDIKFSKNIKEIQGYNKKLICFN